MDYNSLNDDEKRVIENKATERPFSGKYNDFDEDGIYKCKKCNTKLYASSTKFSSGCGWPSFDDDLGMVKRIPDADGKRVEIVCSNCDAHLGHVFEGEGFSEKNTRHCVNSISLNFEEKGCCGTTSVAYFAAGCFWGVEYHFEKHKGVKAAVSGYMGGDVANPDYESVCSGMTGHLEVVKVDYDSTLVDYETLAKLFFETHDFTQTNGQGPDIGSQYLSAIFYDNEEEKCITQNLIGLLNAKGYEVATSLISTHNTPFFEAEEYHQDYYDRHQKVPYCHMLKKVF